MKKFSRYKLLSVGLAVAAVALLLAGLIERQATIGQSSTRSPDGNWCLNLKLIEYVTLFSSRKVLEADVVHATHGDWTVRTSIPLDHADARTISNKHPDYTIVWSDDSSRVSYWINEDVEDFIKIEADAERVTFQRGLFGFRVVETFPDAAESPTVE